ncbi:MAG TPA: hypothetical protein VF061_04855, partial [Gemmatimonadales bacterium]
LGGGGGRVGRRGHPAPRSRSLGLRILGFQNFDTRIAIGDLRTGSTDRDSQYTVDPDGGSKAAMGPGWDSRPVGDDPVQNHAVALQAGHMSRVAGFFRYTM